MGQAHPLTQMHPLGSLLAPLLNVGPYAVPGSHEVSNNFSAPLSAAPWLVIYGPSTRRMIDLAMPEQAQGYCLWGRAASLQPALPGPGPALCAWRV